MKLEQKSPVSEFAPMGRMLLRSSSFMSQLQAATSFSEKNQTTLKTLQTMKQDHPTSDASESVVQGKRTKVTKAMPPPQLCVNSDMVYLARTANGFSQTQLAENLKVTQSRLSRVEDGLSGPVAPEFVEQLAQATKFPEEFFLQSGARAPLREAFFRRKRSVNIGTLKQAEAVINIQRLAIENLLAKNEIVSDLPLPYWDPEAFAGGPVEVARQLRYAWRIPPGPIKNLTELVEMAGVVVQFVDFPTPSIDGVTVWMSGGIPLILLNPLFPAVKLRMTLAHELGHVIMHRVPSADMEEEAFTFAAEFLMPEREIGVNLYPLDLDSLLLLKLKWKTAMQAILMHAKRLGRIKEGYYKFLMMKISQRGWRKNEPEDNRIPHEEPQTVRELVDMHRDELGYTDDEILSVMKVSSDMASRIIRCKPQLRAL